MARYEYGIERGGFIETLSIDQAMTLVQSGYTVWVFEYDPRQDCYGCIGDLVGFNGSEPVVC